MNSQGISVDTLTHLPHPQPTAEDAPDAEEDLQGLGAVPFPSYPTHSRAPTPITAGSYTPPNSPARPLQPPTTAEWWFTPSEFTCCHDCQVPPGLEVYAGFSRLATSEPSHVVERSSDPHDLILPRKPSVVGMNHEDWSPNLSSIDQPSGTISDSIESYNSGASSLGANNSVAVPRTHYSATRLLAPKPHPQATFISTSTTSPIPLSRMPSNPRHSLIHFEPAVPRLRRISSLTENLNPPPSLYAVSPKSDSAAASQSQVLSYTDHDDSGIHWFPRVWDRFRKIGCGRAHVEDGESYDDHESNSYHHHQELYSPPMLSGGLNMAHGHHVQWLPDGNFTDSPTPLSSSIPELPLQIPCNTTDSTTGELDSRRGIDGLPPDERSLYSTTTVYRCNFCTPAGRRYRSVERVRRHLSAVHGISFMRRDGVHGGYICAGNDANHEGSGSDDKEKTRARDARHV